MSWLTKRAVIISLCNYLSVGIALLMAFWMNLPNPWWAMLTVYIAQPMHRLAGAVWAKAAYRVIGTAIGGIAAIVIVPNLSNSPVLLLLGVGGWLALCVFGGMHDRTPRSYMFMLAGYTVALIGLPLASNPAGIFDVAVARVEEIVIGVLAIAFVQSILLPQSIGSLALEKISSVMRTTHAWMLNGLATHGPSPAPYELVAHLAEINLLASDWRFEGTLPDWKRRALWAWEERMVALLPAITGVEDLLLLSSDSGGNAREVQLVAAHVRIGSSKRDWPARYLSRRCAP